MKRLLVFSMRVLMAMLVALTIMSCSKKDDSRTVKPAGHDKMVEERIRDIEESKKIVVAKVNGTEIRMNELVERMNFIAPLYAKSPQEMTPELDRKVKKHALDVLIFRELAIQEAVRKGISAPPQEVTERVRQAQAEAGSEEAFRKNLRMAGQTEESFREMTERNLLFDRMADQEINRKIRIDERRLREAYEREKASLLIPEVIVVDEVRISGVGDEASAVKKANEVLSFIRKNNNDVMKTPRDNAVQVRQGQMTKAEYPETFKAAEGMKVDELSGVIRATDGLHIIKLLGREPARTMSFDEARPQLENELKAPLIAKRKQEWEAALKKNAKIEILLDTGVRANTGS